LPTSIFTTDLEGAFSVVLPAGRYRVAAVKPGYDVAMTEIHTLVRGLLKLELVQSSNLVLGDLPVGTAGQNLGTDWILRQHKGDVLRDEGPAMAWGEAAHGRAGSLPTASMIAPDGENATSVPVALEGRFVQQLSGASPFAAGEAPSGRATGLSLDGALGENRFWRFEGATERGDAVTDGEAGKLDTRSDRLAAGIDYAFGERDTLAGDFSYGTKKYLIDQAGVPGASTDQTQRTFGLRSRWDRALQAGAAIHATGEYFESGARVGGATASPASGFDLAAMDDRITNRAWSGRAGLALSGGAHRIDLEVEAEGYSFSGWEDGVVLHGLPYVPGFSATGDAGNAYSLRAGDRWQAFERTEIDYGVGYHGGFAGGGAYLVPRVGMTLVPTAQGSVVLRTALLYRVGDGAAARTGGFDSTAGDAAHGEADRFGYLIGIEMRPPDRLQLAATLSYQPFVQRYGMGAVSGSPTLVDDRPLFLSDGAAGRHELELEMMRSFGPLQGRLAGRVGRAEGRVTPAVEEAPVQVLSSGEVRYYQTQVWALYEPTDTEVKIDYRSVLAEDSAGSSRLDARSYRRLDLVVYQDIPRPRLLRNARLRVLMAYQDFDYDSLFDGSSDAPVSGSATRLTGGLDIRF
jgi:hypothetical protein